VRPKHFLRAVDKGDHSFIHDAWWKTVRPRYQFTDGQLLKSAITNHVEHSIQAGLKTNMIACDQEDPTLIYSVLMWHPITPTLAAIDFGYTKNIVRRLGFQAELMKALGSYKTQVITIHAPSFSSNEYYDASQEPFGYRLKRSGLIIDPFFYERLSHVNYGEKR